jgi:hypothetical protein
LSNGRSLEENAPWLIVTGFATYASIWWGILSD